MLTKPIGAVSGGLAVAGFGYGLYSAGIGHTDFTPQTVEELNDTKTMTSCLDSAWRFATSREGSVGG